MENYGALFTFAEDEGKWRCVLQCSVCLQSVCGYVYCLLCVRVCVHMRVRVFSAIMTDCVGHHRAVFFTITSLYTTCLMSCHHLCWKAPMAHGSHQCDSLE